MSETLGARTNTVQIGWKYPSSQWLILAMLKDAYNIK